MTLSRSNTPLGEKRELHESVQELDNLLEDLKKAQVTDERSYSKRLDQQSHFYDSTSSLNVPANSTSKYGTRSSSSTSQTNPLHSLVSSQQEVDTYTSRLESELSRAQDPIPRGVFVKDVVEEEILLDHVLIQPKTQQSDKKFITRPSERKQSERAKRQVVFKNLKDNCYPQDDSETYDNTDTEEAGYVAKRDVKDQSASMQSLNSVTTDQSEFTDTSSILDPSKVINCHACGGRVVGQVITALGKNYHKEHFTCAHCNQELGTRNFYERNGLPYCEKDYQALFSPKCGACGEPILDVSSKSV